MIINTQQTIFWGVKLCLKAKVFLQEILLVWQKVNLCKAGAMVDRA